MVIGHIEGEVIVLFTKHFMVISGIDITIEIKEKYFMGIIMMMLKKVIMMKRTFKVKV